MLRKVEPISLGCDVRIEGDHIAVTGLSLRDADLAGYLGEQSEVDRFRCRRIASHATLAGGGTRTGMAASISRESEAHDSGAELKPGADRRVPMRRPLSQLVS